MELFAEVIRSVGRTPATSRRLPVDDLFWGRTAAERTSPCRRARSGAWSCPKGTDAQLRALTSFRDSEQFSEAEKVLECPSAGGGSDVSGEGPPRTRSTR
jgi:hypothetical protein